MLRHEIESMGTDAWVNSNRKERNTHVKRLNRRSTRSDSTNGRSPSLLSRTCSICVFWLLLPRLYSSKTSSNILRPCWTLGHSFASRPSIPFDRAPKRRSVSVSGRDARSPPPPWLVRYAASYVHVARDAVGIEVVGYGDAPSTFCLASLLSDTIPPPPGESSGAVELDELQGLGASKRRLNPAYCALRAMTPSR